MGALYLTSKLLGELSLTFGIVMIDGIFLIKSYDFIVGILFDQGFDVDLWSLS